MTREAPGKPATGQTGKGSAKRPVAGRQEASSPLPNRQPNSGARQAAGRDGSAQARPAGRRDGAPPRRSDEHRTPISSAEERRAPRSARLDEVRSGKRDRFLTDQSAQRKRKGYLYVGIPLLVVILAGVILYFVGGDSAGSKPGVGLRRSAGLFAAVAPVDGLVKFALSDLQDGKARYYTYKTAADKEIDFFVLKSADGVIRAAIDSCDVCFSFRKGYHQEGDEMVCNNCGQRFPSNKINVLKGGCNPAPLTRIIDGDSLVITEKDIITDGDQYF